MARRALAVRRLGVAGLAALWLASLLLPVAGAHTINGDVVIGGLDVLELGWLGLLLFNLGWFANLSGLWLAILIAADRDPRRHRTLLIAHGLFVAMALLWRSYPSNEGMPEHDNIFAWHAGYFLWMAAMIGVGALAIWPGRRAPSPGIKD